MSAYNAEEEALFASLPTRKPSEYGLPPWAETMMKAGLNHDPSTTIENEDTADTPLGPDDWRKKFEGNMIDPVDLGKWDRPIRAGATGAYTDLWSDEDRSKAAEAPEGEEEDDEVEQWEDALEEHLELNGRTEFSTEELQQLFKSATDLKAKANALFSPPSSTDPSSPTPVPDLDGALAAYKSALEYLPLTSLSPDHPSNLPPPPPQNDGPSDPDSDAMFSDKPNARDSNTNSKTTSVPPIPIPDPKPGELLELTDEQAEALEAEQKAAEEIERKKAEEEAKPEVKRKREIEREIEELKKVVWGNMGAVYVKKNDDKESMAACSQALKIDPMYVKALHRRATAGERLDSWTTLTTAQEDYQTLLTLLPSSTPIYKSAKRALVALPSRIATQQNKEKDEMFSKLKELGNGLLGKFGMSTDNFKFDPQPGGGYSMRFER